MDEGDPGGRHHRRLREVTGDGSRITSQQLICGVSNEFRYSKEIPMKVDGGCHCGHIRFEADVDPETAGICHCTDCQALSGSAYRPNVRTVRGGFKLLAGQPKLYIKTAESGTKRAH